MMQAITTGVTSLITWGGQVISAVFGASGAWKDLAVLFGLGVAVSVVMVGVRIVRSFSWGA